MQKSILSAVAGRDTRDFGLEKLIRAHPPAEVNV